jgi:hypothetical protein
MAPPSVQVTINQKSYSIPLLTGDMENISIQMERQKEQINRDRRRLNETKAELDNNCNTLLLMYIQQTGQYPE